MARFSVIVPVFNGASFIREAIESVFSQTIQDFEIIVVDDGSTDQSKEIVERMNVAVKYLYQSNNGAAAARNKGVEVSQGEYIAFLDQDDRWYPSKLEMQWRMLEANSESEIVYAEMDVIDANGSVIAKSYLQNGAAQWSALFAMAIPKFPNPFPYPSTVMMPRSTFEKYGMYDPIFRRNNCEDIELWARIVKAGGRFVFCKEPLAQYRLHAQQGGKNEEMWRQNWSVLMERLLWLYRDDSEVKKALAQLSRRYLRSKARSCSREGEELIRSGDLQRGRELLKWAFKYRPLYCKNLFRFFNSYIVRR